MKVKKLFLLSAAILLSVVTCVACNKTPGGGSDLPKNDLVLPTENVNHGNVSVHDPSVFYDEISGVYYAFGTHFSVASSTDLVKWKQEVYEQDSRKLYGKDYKEVITETISRVKGGTGSTWAPDVNYINGKYYMYYSLTEKFGSNHSVIGRVSSDNVLGPYGDEEIIVESMGESGAPNAIDPELFPDKDGKLWMVYGSFYGGIYVVELDQNGLPVKPLENGYYGELVWLRGYSEGVEGPFVFYNKTTDYYYLMTSEGDLNTTYNMRVARSKSPNGPYTDIKDEKVSGNGKGNKIAGNYQFEGETLNVALGHNSVVEKDGDYFVICHVRNTFSGGHHLEVHELYFNEEGWPVMSPTQYVGETKGKVTQEQIAGDYDVVTHFIPTKGADNNSTIVKSVKYTFAADGGITDESGTAIGTWTLKDGYYISLTLNEITYSGVVCAGWRTTSNGNAGVLCIIANSTTGNPVWAQGVISG